MKLKNYIFLLASGILAACSSSDNEDTIIAPPVINKAIPETQLFAGIANSEEENGGLVSVSAQTRATDAAATSILPEAKTDNAYFTTRIDSYLNQVNSNNGRIDANNDYYPLSESLGSGRVVAQLPENTGTVYTNHPTVTYTPSTGKNMKSYVFSTDGSATATILSGVPTMEEILKAHYPNRPNIVLDYTRMPADVNKDNLHIIWYVVKLLSGGDKLWHVDGILTDKNDIREVIARTPSAKFWEVDELEPMTFDPNNATLRYDEEVNVDVHQQEHKDWGEIKTTIHIKTPKDVKVTIPVSDELIATNPEILDNIALRDFDLPLNLKSYNNKFFADVKVKVERDQNGIAISVTGLTPTVLKAIEDQYADGLTIEVHTYTTFNEGDADKVWRQLCNSKVETAAKVSGQVTSAYKTAATDKRIFNEKGEAVYGAINDPNAK